MPVILSTRPGPAGWLGACRRPPPPAVVFPAGPSPSGRLPFPCLLVARPLPSRASGLRCRPGLAGCPLSASLSQLVNVYFPLKLSVLTSDDALRDVA